MKQRMRRISALLLVVLMCVSMVVPAFAAESAGCPGETREHNKDNCDYTQIGEPHEAGCGKQGYTAYQCNECGVYFADDFVESFGEHAWQYVEQDATCTEDGFAKRVCLNCGEEESTIPAGQESNYKAPGHNWKLNGETCKDGMVCTVCGETKAEADSDRHYWLAPELNKAPIHGANGVTPGQATLKCKYCDATKTVTVECSAEHNFKFYDKVEPTCETTGTQAGYKCTICGKVAVDAAGTAYDSAVHTVEPLAVIPTIDHKTSAEWVVVAPTCTESGKAYRVCTMCEEMIGTPIVLNPVGHNFQTKIYIEVEAGGMTADKVAMFEGLAAGMSDEDYDYSILVKKADGTFETVTGKVHVPAVLAADAKPTVAADSTTTVDPNAKYYVWSGEYQKDSPLDYDDNGDQWMHWGTDCQTKTHYYTFVCINCDYREDTQYFTGHYFVEVGRTAPDCDTATPGSIVYQCANPNCVGKGVADGDEITNGTRADGSTVAVKTVEIEAVHSWVTETVAPNCKNKGYSVDVCEHCGAVDQTKGAEGTTNGWYNITEVVADKHTPVDNVFLAPTCTTGGYKNVKCEICGTMLETQVPLAALGHDLDKTTFAKDPTSASCAAPGYNYYKCNRCGETIAEQNAAQKNHDFSKLEVTLPNCTTKEDGYTTVYCKNCNEPNPEQLKINPVPYDPTNNEHHTGANVLHVEYGNCDNYDVVTWQCLHCEDENGDPYVWTVEVEHKVAGVGTGHGTGHNYQAVAAVAPTCKLDGIKAHYKCTKCGELSSSANGGIENVLTAAEIVDPKLTEDGVCDPEKLITIEAVAPTCTTDGNTAGTKCSVCGELVGGTKLSKLNHKENGLSAWTTVSSTSHEVPSREDSCLDWGYNHIACSLCGEEKIVDYAAAIGSHTIDTDDTGYKATCCAPGLTDAEICTVCGEVVKAAEEIAQLAHKNAAGEEFYGLCSDTVEDRLCVVCKSGKDADGYAFTCPVGGNHDHREDIVKNDGTVLVEDSKGAHEWVETYVEATCMSYSYTLVVCKHCHYEYMEDEGFEYTDEHLEWSDWSVEKEATTLEEGLKVRTCKCGAKEEVVIPALAGLEYIIEIENAVKEGYELANGTKVNVTVKTNTSDLDVWGLRLSLNYSSNLTCTGVIVDKNAKFGETLSVTYNKNNLVITAAAPNVDGKLSDVTLDGEEVLVTLQFTVSGSAKIGDTVSVFADDDDLCELNDKDQNLIKVVKPEEATATVKARIMDVLADGTYDINDAKLLMLYVTGEAEGEYCTAADTDYDGEITVEDFTKLFNWLARGNK